jgi:ornithine cyclodeaminase/alanine dehydrogenase-like protein (mu-crystallin family)
MITLLAKDRLIRYSIISIEMRLMSKIRFLAAEDVKKALPMREAIEGMKSAYVQMSLGQADMPLRGRVAGLNDGVTLLMPAFLQQSGEMGVKIVSVFPQNSAQNLPIIHAMVLALDASTGQALGIIEGSSLTAIRTGAGAGAATDVLARPNASSVAIIGTGVQARTQLEAMVTVRPIEVAYVFSPNRAHAQAFAEEMASYAKEILIPRNANEAIQDADIICTATTSSSPVFDGKIIKAGTHINGVGSYLPTMQELDEVTMLRSLITVDSREAVMAEAGEIIIAVEKGVAEIHAEIGEIFAGKKLGRSSAEQITFFKSCGIAVQDAMAAAIALKNAEAFNIGTVLEM